MCTDIDELSYIVTKLSLSEIYNLLHGKIPMRDAFLKQQEYWEIVSGDEICMDMVTKKKIDALEQSSFSELPLYGEKLHPVKTTEDTYSKNINIVFNTEIYR